MRIGIADCLKEDKYDLYVRWILEADPSAEIVKLSYKLKNAARVSDIDGLLLTGGGDVHPRHYGVEKGRAEGVDEQRDEFEFEIIDRALDGDLPVLGICRGMQVTNVYLGGTLAIDLVSDGLENHSSPKNSETMHPIVIEPLSLLGAVAGDAERVVNSYHHQAVQRLGKGLIAAARSNDGVIEAAEWVMKDGMPFLLLVQWHPERGAIRETQFSKSLAALFLREVQHSRQLKQTTR